MVADPLGLLLIHTGGTIAMAPGARGLEPCPGLLEAAVRTRLGAADRLDCHSFAPLLDSADVGPEHWNCILDLIDSHPGQPVLLTHGTDTMAYTGAALDRALAGSGRSVILCGAMTPLGVDGVAERSLELALTLSRAPESGVRLVFDGRSLPAAGLVKQHSNATDAFSNIPQAPAQAPARRRFDNRRLAVLTLSPGLSAEALEAQLAPLDSAVLRLFGAGTAPTDPALHRVIDRAIRAGTRLRAVSQCMTGGLAPGTYAAGNSLWAAGVENGGTETPETALAELWLG
ncbi:asparaginase domain-containing protein [Sagittula stellata]|uniref:Cytoplasmic asparaginase I n=1 Tax=Sagittula stellata (strain ATCC 700073 / DSM 11524 / E-37) TaxID=388399 RepID=A3K4H5_SAGS3|nr:asparaginase domain-containing protein [Sagittula stellata]EBA07874.1 cytoplasmic asparaginase I [Sagittula stellata E-37]